jgi:membrane-bound lytic murein transglycosylase A
MTTFNRAPNNTHFTALRLFIYLWTLSMLAASCTTTQASGVDREMVSTPEKNETSERLTKKILKKASDNKARPPLPTGLPKILQDDLDRASLRQVVQNQFDAMQEADLSLRVQLGPWTLTQGHLRKNLESFLKLIDENLPQREFSKRILEEYVLYKGGKGKKKKMLFTGYYTPVIKASPVRTEEYIYPLYRAPSEPVNVRLISGSSDEETDMEGSHSLKSWRTLTREQIDREGALTRKGLEIAWLKDDLERFFLHIQGSGTLRFPDGSTHGVQFVAANGYTYKGIGRLMVRDGVIKLSQGSMQGIKHYLRNNPQDIPKYFYQNKRYIFFDWSGVNPLGSGGGELVAGRSIATDKSIYPAGGLAFIRLRKPVLDTQGKIKSWVPVSRFVADQDTGNAIRGPGRADLYFGAGNEPGVKAGHFKEWGEVYYLMNKEILTGLR